MAVERRKKILGEASVTQNTHRLRSVRQPQSSEADAKGRAHHPALPQPASLHPRGGAVAQDSPELEDLQLAQSG